MPEFRIEELVPEEVRMGNLSCSEKGNWTLALSTPTSVKKLSNSGKSEDSTVLWEALMDGCDGSKTEETDGCDGSETEETDTDKKKLREF